ncbi:MAG: 3-methylcrotonyl-CoA carboxylase, partial [Alphaproteobacteria bacterium]|nr:3-methylcrotonyl-CoA carboxylase [Alphaproteobacteria bacterium]
YGRGREEARRRLIRGLVGTTLLGVPNNRGFLLDVLRHDNFRDGAATTAFIPTHFSDPQRPQPDATARALAAVLLYRHGAREQIGWRPASPMAVAIDLRSGNMQYPCRVMAAADGYRVELGDEVVELSLSSIQDAWIRFESGGILQGAAFAFDGDDLHLDLAGVSHGFIEFTPALASAKVRDGNGRLTAPMAGRIVAVRARVGDDVVKGQILVILEAMKMEHEIKAPGDGVLGSVLVATGDQVEPKQILAMVIPPETAI